MTKAFPDDEVEVEDFGAIVKNVVKSISYENATWLSVESNSRVGNDTRWKVVAYNTKQRFPKYPKRVSPKKTC